MKTINWDEMERDIEEEEIEEEIERRNE